MMIKTRLP